MHVRFSYVCKNKDHVSITINVSLPIGDSNKGFDEVQKKMDQIIADMGLTVMTRQAHQYSSCGHLVIIWY